MKLRLAFRLIPGDEAALGPGKSETARSRLVTRARKATEVALAKRGRPLKPVP